MKDDTISRQAAIKAADSIIERDTSGNNDVVKAMTAWKKFIEGLPPSQPKYDEWCTGCREYNAERHSCPRWNRVIRQTVDDMKAAQPWWIPCSERLPECEQEVLICTKKKVYVSKKTGMEWYEESIVTPALYEDGTMLEVNSKWHWEDIDYAGWDEEEDCGIIPEGWWENRHFNPDETYNNVVDREVIAWMPLPTPYREGGQDG